MLGGSADRAEPRAERGDGQRALVPVAGNHGGLVTDTGIALVHEGEVIFPKPESEAQVTLARYDAGTEVHIHLPVVVELVGRLDGREMEQTVDETLRRLRLAVEAQPREA